MCQNWLCSATEYLLIETHECHLSKQCYRYLAKNSLTMGSVGNVTTSQPQCSSMVLCLGSGVVNVFLMFAWGSCGHSLCLTPSKCRWTGYSKLPPSVSVYVHGTLWWTGLPSRVYSHLMLGVPGIDSRPNHDPDQDKVITKMNGWLDSLGFMHHYDLIF